MLRHDRANTPARPAIPGPARRRVAVTGRPGHGDREAGSRRPGGRVTATGRPGHGDRELARHQRAADHRADGGAVAGPRAPSRAPAVISRAFPAPRVPGCQPDAPAPPVGRAGYGDLRERRRTVVRDVPGVTEVMRALVIDGPGSARV